MSSQINDSNNENRNEIHEAEKTLNEASSKTEVKDDYDGYVFATHRKHHKKKLSIGRKIILGLLITLLSVFVLVSTTLFTLNLVGRNALLDTSQATVSTAKVKEAEVDDNLRTITYKGVKYKANENITTILAMGIDRDNLEEMTNGSAGQADLIMAIAHDTSTGDTTAINIPRDTITDIDVYDTQGNFVDTEKKQICLAYAYGDGREKSCENVKKSVSALLYGTQINSYFALDFAAIPVLNDAVDGVKLKSLETIGPFVEGQDLWLWGEDATTYVRKRNMDVINANLLRNNRQFQYLNAFIKKVVDETKEDISTPLNLFDKMSDYMITDIDAGKVTFLATNALTKGFKNVNFISVPGEMVKAEPYVEYHYNEDELFQMYLDVYYKVVE